MLEAGNPVADLPLVEPGGRETTLSSLLAEQGTPILLAFFKVSCPVCQYTFPFLNRLVVPGKLSVFGVSQDDEEATEQFGAEFGLDFPLLMDPAARGYVASNAFKISVVPSLFLLGAERRIEFASAGFARRELEELGHRFGVAVFRPDEKTPEFKPG